MHIWRIFPAQLAVETPVGLMGDAIILQLLLSQKSHGASYWSNNAWQHYWKELLETRWSLPGTVKSTFTKFALFCFTSPNLTVFMFFSVCTLVILSLWSLSLWNRRPSTSMFGVLVWWSMQRKVLLANLKLAVNHDCFSLQVKSLSQDMVADFVIQDFWSCGCYCWCCWWCSCCCYFYCYCGCYCCGSLGNRCAI